jgi:two-component system, NarL family, response regulator NreC
VNGDIIHVLLADDHTVVRAGLKAVLGGAPDIKVIGEASNGADAVAMTRRLHPEVLIMDLSMPQMDGAEAARQLISDGTSTRILILTMHSPDEALIPLIEAGVQGFLQKTAADRELVDAVRAVAHGDTYLQPSAARVLAGGLRKRAEHAGDRQRFEQLTPREQEVLRMVAQGHAASEIGRRLNISPKTVDTYKQRIKEKVGLTHRPEYVQFALKLGLLPED